MCRSAVNDGSCSPWVMCSSSVVRGNQIRDTYRHKHEHLENSKPAQRIQGHFRDRPTKIHEGLAVYHCHPSHHYQELKQGFPQ